MMESTELENWFRSIGKKRQIPSNESLPIQEKGLMWFLEKGTVNLYAQSQSKRLDDMGPRKLISHFQAPFPIFSMGLEPSNQDCQLVAITETFCDIWEIETEKIQEMGLQLLQQWINGLSQFFVTEEPFDSMKYILAPKEIILEKGERLSLKRALRPSEKKRIQWIQIQEGAVTFFGRASLTLEPDKGVFLLPYQSWVTASDRARIKALEDEPNWEESLRSFHSLFFNYVKERMNEQEEEENQIFQNRNQEEEKRLRAALSEMHTVATGDAHLQPFEGGSPLQKACLILGKAQNISFVGPSKEVQSQDVNSQIKSLCQHCGIRFRKVELKDQWWKKCSGPLLGFYGPEQIPVALLNSSGVSYEMQKPDVKGAKRVNLGLSQEISNEAYVFYPPLPPNIRFGKEMLQFYFKATFKDVIQLMTFSVFAAILALFPLFSMVILFDIVIPDSSVSLFWQVSIGLFVAALGTSLFLYFRSLKLVKIEGELSHNIQVGIWDRLLYLPISFFHKFSVGDLILRVLSIENIRSIASGNVSRALTTSIFSFFYLIAMLFLSPILALVGAGIVALGLLITYVCVKSLLRFEEKILKLQGEINGFLVQMIGAVGKLRSAGAENNVFSTWALLFARKKKWELRAQNMRSIVAICNYLMPLIGIACILTAILVGGWSYSAGVFIAFITGFILFSMQIAELNNKWIEMIPASPMWNRSKAILEEAPEERQDKQSPGILSGEIAFDEVFFRYNLKGPYILNNVSIKVNPHEFIGIVGPSGAGKSTLLRQLIGFEFPSSGAVYYNGKDLSHLNLQEVRSQLGLALQGSEIIPGTILENLTCGSVYTDERIEEALVMSGLKEELEDFPMGLFTILPMGAETLSGGQKQKILIARALLPKPKVLIFDEATSALDSVAQAQLVQALSHLDVTRIVVAHRLSTLKNADRIYVMDKGEIVQVGLFEELAKKPGLFSDMFHIQNL